MLVFVHVQVPAMGIYLSGLDKHYLGGWHLWHTLNSLGLDFWTSVLVCRKQKQAVCIVSQTGLVQHPFAYEIQNVAYRTAGAL